MKKYYIVCFAVVVAGVIKELTDTIIDTHENVTYLNREKLMEELLELAKTGHEGDLAVQILGITPINYQEHKCYIEKRKVRAADATE